jgi:hypothetical protein
LAVSSGTGFLQIQQLKECVVADDMVASEEDHLIAQESDAQNGSGGGVCKRLLKSNRPLAIASLTTSGK